MTVGLPAHRSSSRRGELRLHRVRALFSRLALGAAATLLAGVVAELLLRAWFPDLPSLSGLVGSPYRAIPTEPLPDTDAFEPWDSPLCRTETLLADAQSVDADPAVPGALRLLVLGDSVARGGGAFRGQGVANLVADGLAEALDHPVVLRNAAIVGGGTCDETLAGHLDLASHPADLLLWLQFADDLRPRNILRVHGQAVAFPELSRLPGARRWYLLNAAWFTWMLLPQSRSTSPRVTIGDGLYVDLVGGLLDRATALDVPTLRVLIAPSGQDSCPPAPPEGSICAAFRADEERMTRLSRRFPQPFLDLTDFWTAHPGHTTASEQGGHQPTDLCIHPDQEGHRLLADAITPILVETWNAHRATR